jgi:hypothetical protein
LRYFFLPVKILFDVGRRPGLSPRKRWKNQWRRAVWTWPFAVARAQSVQDELQRKLGVKAIKLEEVGHIPVRL